MLDPFQGLQRFDDLFKAAVHLRNGPVDVGPYRLRFGGFVGVGTLPAEMYRLNVAPVIPSFFATSCVENVRIMYGSYR
jgi:hypothetical protein